MYEGMKEFDEAHSMSFPLKKSDGWAADGVDLFKSDGWDRNVNIVQLKLEILGPNQETLASVDPAKANAPAQASSNLLVINSIILDRHAFSGQLNLGFPEAAEMRQMRVDKVSWKHLNACCAVMMLTVLPILLLAQGTRSRSRTNTP
jgi:hypothetical protein